LHAILILVKLKFVYFLSNGLFGLAFGDICFATLYKVQRDFKKLVFLSSLQTQIVAVILA